jgi:hypothetical protein
MEVLSRYEIRMSHSSQLQYLKHPDVHRAINRSHVPNLRDDIVIGSDSLILLTLLLCQQKCMERLSEANDQPQLSRSQLVVSSMAGARII